MDKVTKRHANPAPYRLDGFLVSLCRAEPKTSNPSTLLWDELNARWCVSFRAPNMVDDKSGWWRQGCYGFITGAKFCPWCGEELEPPPDADRERDKVETADQVLEAADWIRKHMPPPERPKGHGQTS